MPPLMEPMLVDGSAHASNSSSPAKQANPSGPNIDPPVTNSASTNDSNQQTTTNNVLTREKAVILKNKLSDLLHQATLAVESKTPSESSIIITGTSEVTQPAQPAQMITRARVVVQPLSVGEVDQPLRKEASATTTTETTQLKFISERTKNWLNENIWQKDDENWMCRVCHWDGPKKRVQIHIKQHQIRMFCPCGYNKVSRDMVYDHQSSHQYEKKSGHGPRAGFIYQVDRSSYHDWATRVMGWAEPPPFADPHPTLKGELGKAPPRGNRGNQKSSPRKPTQEERRVSPITVRRVQDRPMPGRTHSSRTTTSKHTSRSRQREDKRHQGRSSTSGHRSRSQRAEGRPSGPSPGVEHLGERRPDIQQSSQEERASVHSRGQTVPTQRGTSPPERGQHSHQQGSEYPQQAHLVQAPRPRPPSTVIRNPADALPEVTPPQRHGEDEPGIPAPGVGHLGAGEITQADATGTVNQATEDPVTKVVGGVEHSPQEYPEPGVPASRVEYLEAGETTQTDATGVVNSATGDPVAEVVGGVEHSPQPHLERPEEEDSSDTSLQDELTRTGDDRTLGDRSLLTRVLGQTPTSLKLHYIRDAWDALILHEIRATDSEAEQLKARATLYPAGSRVWRLLREEARRLQQHGALSRVWLSNRVEPPGPYIRTPDSTETDS